MSESDAKKVKSIKTLRAYALVAAFDMIEDEQATCYRKISKRHLGLCKEGLSLFNKPYAPLILNAFGPMKYSTWKIVKQKHICTMITITCGWICTGYYQKPACVHMLTRPARVKDAWHEVSDFRRVVFIREGPYYDELDSAAVPCNEWFKLAYRCARQGVYVTIDGLGFKEYLESQR